MASSFPKRHSRHNPFVPPHLRLVPLPKRSPKPRHQPYVPHHLRFTHDYASCQWSELPPYSPTPRPSPLPRDYHVLDSSYVRQPSRQPTSKRVTFWDLENGYEASDERGFMAHKVKKKCIVVAAPFVSPVGGTIISPVQQQIEKGMEEEISKEMASMRTHLDDMVHNCSRHDAALIDPLGSTIFTNDQHLFESKIDSPMAEISEKQEELSIGLTKAMRCLELQRKIWDIGSLFSIIPAVPTLNIRDPFLAHDGRPTPLRSLLFAPLEACNGNATGQLRLSHRQRADVFLKHKGTLRDVASRAKLPKGEGNDVGMGYYFSCWRPPDSLWFELSGFKRGVHNLCVSRHIVGERPPRARLRHVRLHSLAILLIRGRITSKRDMMMQA